MLKFFVYKFEKVINHKNINRQQDQHQDLSLVLGKPCKPLVQGNSERNVAKRQAGRDTYYVRQFNAHVCSFIYEICTCFTFFFDSL